MTAALQKIRLQLKRRWLAFVGAPLILFSVAFGIFHAKLQHHENRYVEEMAQNITRQANALDETSKVIALRDYLRQNVSRKSYPVVGRPFLRDTAEQALRTGQGRCGEVTRAFINMAGSIGIHAQRLYLEGQVEHVVALVRLNDGRQVLVDSTEQPYFQDLETLDQLSRHPQFNYYEPINIHRFFRRIRVPANTADLGPLAYLIENPHAFKAVCGFSLAGVCIMLFALSFARGYVRSRRGTELAGSSVMRHPAAALATVDQ